MMEDTKVVCPLTSIGQEFLFQNCIKEECAWWIEDKQKCAIAVLGAKK